MKLNLMTTEDLHQFKQELLEELKRVIQANGAPQHKWLRSHQVQDLLNISAGTLHNLRERKLLPHSRLAGIILYEYNDIIELLRKNKIK